MIKTKIYYLTDETGSVRYVGKTDRSLKSRLSHHLWKSRQIKKQHVHCWIQSKGEKNIKIILIEECSSEIWHIREKHWIKYYKAKGEKLTNHTIGGDGRSGFEVSDETKEKLKKASSGRKFSEETKKKIADFHRGRKRSYETKEKIRRASIGRRLSEETKEKISKRKKGVKNYNYPKNRKSKKSKMTKEMETDILNGMNSTEWKNKYNISTSIWSFIRKKNGIKNDKKIKTKKEKKPQYNLTYITPEMIIDLKKNITRRDFKLKYNTTSLWNRYHKKYRNTQKKITK